MLSDALVRPDEAVEGSRRFGGLERLYGVNGFRRIRGAHVIIVGLGGVGSWAAESLARSGVGRLTLIDMDHIAESNINRQIHSLQSTLGQAKVDAMRDRILQINPACAVMAVDEFVEPDGWATLLARAVSQNGPVSAVIDACDQGRAKLAMALWSREAELAFVSCGAAGGKRHAHKVDVCDLDQVTHDPLLARMRQQLRKSSHGRLKPGRKTGVTCVFSRESVAPPDVSCAVEGDGSLNCSGYGSVVTVTATFGQCAAGWVLDRIFVTGDAVY